MARLWYSVHGEGWGHAVRSGVVIEHLQREHELFITAAHKAYTYLRTRFPDLHILEIEGPRMVYNDAGIMVGRTVRAALAQLSDQTRESLRVIFGDVSAFDPHVILSDFEPLSNYAAPLLHRPLININNISALTKSHIHI